MNDKVCFGCVVYNENAKFLNEFFRSVRHQTYKSFDFLIIDDGLSIERPGGWFLPEDKVIHVKEKKSPSELRIMLLLEAKKRDYDLIIIGDCDDEFLDNRIEKTVERYRDYPDEWFYYNELISFNDKQLMPTLPYEVNKIQDIGDCNFLGMSNTAINLKKTSAEFIKSLNEYKGKIFDWYLYSRILLVGGKGKLIPDTYTFYRIYEGNEIGLQTDEERDDKEYKEKIYHYGLLKQYDAYMEHLYNSYSNNRFSEHLSDNNLYYWWNHLKED